MNQAQYSKLFSFPYKDIIMPMLVLRRIDVLLEPTKEKVLETQKQLEDMGVGKRCRSCA